MSLVSILTYLNRMEFPTVIIWTSPLPTLGLPDGIFKFYPNCNRTFCKQTLETQNMASDLGLHCLYMSHKKDARLIWVKMHCWSLPSELMQ